MKAIKVVAIIINKQLTGFKLLAQLVVVVIMNDLLLPLMVVVLADNDALSVAFTVAVLIVDVTDADSDADTDDDGDTDDDDGDTDDDDGDGVVGVVLMSVMFAGISNTVALPFNVLYSHSFTCGNISKRHSASLYGSITIECIRPRASAGSVTYGTFLFTLNSVPSFADLPVTL